MEQKIYPKKTIGEYVTGDKVNILGSLGTVIDIEQETSHLVIHSARGISKVSPYVSQNILKKVSDSTDKSDEALNTPPKKGENEQSTGLQKTSQTSQSEKRICDIEKKLDTNHSPAAGENEKGSNQVLPQIKETERLASNSLQEFKTIIFNYDKETVREYFQNADFSDLKPLLINDTETNASRYHAEIKRTKDSPASILSLYIELSYDYRGLYLHMEQLIPRLKINSNQDNCKSVCFVNSNSRLQVDVGIWDTAKYTSLRTGFPKMDTTFLETAIVFFSSQNVSIEFAGITYNLLDQLRKEILSFFWYYFAMLRQSTKKTYLDSISWLQKKYISSFEWNRLDRSKDVKFISVNKETESAIVDGYSGTYYTTLTSCSCPDFQDREYFSPCKHMYALASALKKEFAPIPNLALDKYESFDYSFNRIMMHGTNMKKKLFSNATTTYLYFWKWPVIAIKSGPFNLYLSRMYGFLEGNLYLPDISVNILIDNKKVGTVYSDEEFFEGTSWYRVSATANEAILKELANKDFCSFELRRKKNDSCIEKINIRNASGVAKLFCDLYLPKGAIWKE